MDEFSTLPTITMSELQQRARQFADDLANQLDLIDDRYPNPILSSPGEEDFDNTAYEKAVYEQIKFHSPSNNRGYFERVFISYMSSKYVIIPGLQGAAR